MLASLKQRQAAKKNIKETKAQPKKRGRAKPGTVGEGKFYRVAVRPKNEFVVFRNHDVGRKGHLQRIAGKRKNGTWDTQAWLIAKKKLEDYTEARNKVRKRLSFGGLFY